MPKRPIGERMREARERLKPKMTQLKMAAAISKAIDKRPPYTHASVSGWERDAQKPPHDVVQAWAEMTGRSVAWLHTGLAIGDGEGRSHIPSGGRVVPRIIAVEQVLKKPIDYEHTQTAHTQFPCSENAFALDIFDSRNEPDFREGIERVVIDPDEKKPVPGDMVLAVIDGEAVFGQYTRKEGRTVILYFNGKIADPEPLDPKRGDRIIGVMTEKSTPRRPR